MGIIGTALSHKKEPINIVTCDGCKAGFQNELGMTKIFDLLYAIALATCTYPLATMAVKDLIVPLTTYTIVIILHGVYFWAIGRKYAVRCVGMDGGHISFELPDGKWGVAYTAYKKEKADRRLGRPQAPPPSAVIKADADQANIADHEPAPSALMLEGDQEATIPKDLPELLTFVKLGDTDKVEALIDKGADPTMALGNGMNGLHIACILGEMQMADLLIRRGLSVNGEMANGLTPLHLAVQTNNQNVIGLLLAKKADPNHKNHEGRTPAHWCAGVQDSRLDSSNRYKVAQLLFKGGADVTLQDNDGNIPAQLAEKVGETKVAQLFG